MHGAAAEGYDTSRGLRQLECNPLRPNTEGPRHLPASPRARDPLPFDDKGTRTATPKPTKVPVTWGRVTAWRVGRTIFAGLKHMLEPTGHVQTGIQIVTSTEAHTNRPYSVLR